MSNSIKSAVYDEARACALKWHENGYTQSEILRKLERRQEAQSGESAKAYGRVIVELPGLLKVGRPLSGMELVACKAAGIAPSNFFQATEFPNRIDEKWISGELRIMNFLLNDVEISKDQSRGISVFVSQVRLMESAQKSRKLGHLTLNADTVKYCQAISEGKCYVEEPSKDIPSGANCEVKRGSIAGLKLVRRVAKRQEEPIQKLMRRVDIMMRSLGDVPGILHPIIVQPNDYKSYLPLAEKDLFDQVFATEKEAIPHFIHLLNSVRGIHNRNIAHGDIKPENLLWKDGQILLTDFDFATDITTHPKLSFQGTPRYMAPELYEDGTRDLRVDSFALGMTFYDLMDGPNYFLASTKPEGFYREFKVMEGSNISKYISYAVQPKIDEDVDGKVWPVIKGLLMPRADDRMSLEAAIEALEGSKVAGGAGKAT